ncbi:hypothetical protein [Neptuniibacter halophilus]|uniref:hypothetical protein n=1 Tax=Neptuniibacter halophilus TaxID=651666 RepID=UPI002573AFEF|nr:hypothetical protein [Neptuniibacter halophilus]
MSYVMPQTGLSAHKPEIVTKNLALNHANGNRKVRISSNFLRLMGFEPGQRLTTIAHDRLLDGFTIVPDQAGAQQVYSRTYNRQRTNKPLEALVEFGGQKLLNDCIPQYTERFHAEMRQGQIIIKPLANRVHAIHTRLRKSDPWSGSACRKSVKRRPLAFSVYPEIVQQLFSLSLDSYKALTTQKVLDKYLVRSSLA